MPKLVPKPVVYFVTVVMLPGTTNDDNNEKPMQVSEQQVERSVPVAGAGVPV